MNDPIAEFEAANPCKHTERHGDSDFTGWGPTDEIARLRCHEQVAESKKDKPLTFNTLIRTKHYDQPFSHKPPKRLRDY